MPRYIADYTLNKPDDFVKFVSEDFFAKTGFKLTQFEGEMVWKKGIGMLTAPQFIKFSYNQGVAHLEVWLKIAILPGVYTGEMGLTGFYGWAIKSKLKKDVDTLMSYLNQPLPQQAPGAPQA